jgi:hypothetical protein
MEQKQGSNMKFRVYFAAKSSRRAVIVPQSEIG